MDFADKNQRGPWRVNFVEETGSTNADLITAGLAGAPDRTVLRAGFQSAGRGRLDRTWEAEPGENLLVSFLFRAVPRDPHVLTQAVAMAARHVARSVGVDAVMKWPNDLLVGTEKLAGVLAQAGPLQGDRPSFVVVGIGVNIASAPAGAACLKGSGWTTQITPADFLDAMLPVVDDLLALDESSMHAAYRWRSPPSVRVCVWNSRVTVRSPAGPSMWRLTDASSFSMSVLSRTGSTPPMWCISGRRQPD